MASGSPPQIPAWLHGLAVGHWLTEQLRVKANHELVVELTYPDPQGRYTGMRRRLRPRAEGEPAPELEEWIEEQVRLSWIRMNLGTATKGRRG